jgi:hypothetical protein
VIPEKKLWLEVMHSNKTQPRYYSRPVEAGWSWLKPGRTFNKDRKNEIISKPPSIQ